MLRPLSLSTDVRVKVHYTTCPTKSEVKIPEVNDFCIKQGFSDPFDLYLKGKWITNIFLLRIMCKVHFGHQGLNFRKQNSVV